MFVIPLISINESTWSSLLLLNCELFMFIIPPSLSMTNLPVMSFIVEFVTVSTVFVEILIRLPLPLPDEPKSGADELVIVMFSSTRFPLVILASLP